MKNWQITAIVAAFFMIGFGLAYLIFNCKAIDVSESEKTIARLESSLKTKDKVTEGLAKTIDGLQAQMYSDSVARSEQRSNPITEKQTIEDESTVLSIGKNLYGNSPGKNTKRALIASYGAQAMQENVLLRRIRDNQKAVIANQFGIVAIKDTIIEKQYVIIKSYRKGKAKGRLKWFAWGFVSGYVAGKVF